MSKNRYRAPEIEAEEQVVETATEPAVESAPEVKPVTGVVTNCMELNVREKPDKTGRVICKIAMGDEVLVDSDESTEEWYKVCTKAGVEGFCMKSFIRLIF